jgi:hypothetical protein
MKGRLKSLLLVSVGLTVAVSAEVLVDYQFNDTDGTEFQNAAYTGTAANMVSDSDGDNEWVVYGGALKVVQTAGISRQRGDVASVISSGTITTEVTIASFDLSSITINNTDFGLGVEMTDSADGLIGLRSSTNNLGEVYARNSAAGASRSSGDLGLSSSTPLYLKQIVDLDAGVASGYYMWEGDADWTVITENNSTTYTSGVATVSWIFESDDMGVNDYINIDSYTVTSSAIPEPATLGLLGIMGAGALFIRRRFMI